MKLWLKTNLPEAYDLLSGLKWDIAAWLDYQRPSRRRSAHVQRSWDKLLRDVKSYSVDPAKERVLFFTVRGWPYHVAVDTLCALRLLQRGHGVEFLDCRGELPFCNMGNMRSPEAWHRPCEFCVRTKAAYYHGRFPAQTLGEVSSECREAMDKVRSLDLDGCRNFVWNGVAVGALCAGTVSWFFCRSTLRDSDVPVYRQVLKAGLVVADRFPVHLDRVKPACVTMLSGDFFAERIAADFCRKRGIRFLTHEMTYYDRVIGGINASVTDALCLTAPDRLCRPLTDSQQRVTKRFIRKWLGGNGYLGSAVWKDVTSDPGKIADSLKLDGRPIAVAFTNLTYDMGVLDKDRAFRNIFDWLQELVRYFKDHPEWQLVIRIHPGESKQSQWRTEEPAGDYLKTLPDASAENIRIILPESPISSYSLMGMARVGLTYTSTTTLEMCMKGKPVVTAGKSPFCHRGFTYDPMTSTEYFETVGGLLDGRVKGWSPEREDALLRFVHFLFFRRVYDLEPMKLDPQSRLPVFRITDPDRLTTKDCPALNAFCEAMAFGTEPELP